MKMTSDDKEKTQKIDEEIRSLEGTFDSSWPVYRGFGAAGVAVSLVALIAAEESVVVSALMLAASSVMLFYSYQQRELEKKVRPRIDLLWGERIRVYKESSVSQGPH